MESQKLKKERSEKSISMNKQFGKTIYKLNCDLTHGTDMIEIVVNLLSRFSFSLGW